jgi:hypothetical protein
MDWISSMFSVSWDRMRSRRFDDSDDPQPGEQDAATTTNTHTSHTSKWTSIQVHDGPITTPAPSNKMSIDSLDNQSMLAGELEMFTLPTVIPREERIGGGKWAREDNTSIGGSDCESAGSMTRQQQQQKYQQPPPRLQPRRINQP